MRGVGVEEQFDFRIEKLSNNEKGQLGLENIDPSYFS